MIRIVLHCVKKTLTFEMSIQLKRYILRKPIIGTGKHLSTQKIFQQILFSDRKRGWSCTAKRDGHMNTDIIAWHISIPIDQKMPLLS